MIMPNPDGTPTIEEQALYLSQQTGVPIYPEEMIPAQGLKPVEKTEAQKWNENGMKSSRSEILAPGKNHTILDVELDSAYTSEEFIALLTLLKSQHRVLRIRTIFNENVPEAA